MQIPEKVFSNANITYLCGAILSNEGDNLELNPGIVGLFKEAMDDVVEKKKTEETA